MAINIDDKIIVDLHFFKNWPLDKAVKRKYRFNINEKKSIEIQKEVLKWFTNWIKELPKHREKAIHMHMNWDCHKTIKKELEIEEDEVHKIIRNAKKELTRILNKTAHKYKVWFHNILIK